MDQAKGKAQVSTETLTKKRCDIFGTSRDVQPCTITLHVDGVPAFAVEFDAGRRGRARAANMIRAASMSPAKLREARKVLARVSEGGSRDS